MAITREEKLNKAALKDIAQKMLLAARTAPKACGKDNTVLALVEGNDIKKIARKMKEQGRKHKVDFFIRDADNILKAPVMILLGTKIQSMGLKKCGMCGYKNCAGKEKHPNAPCVFNTGDLGIAVGSAVSVAMDHRVDNRIMYTVGQAVLELGILGRGVKVAYGIPLSATGKNPFFDRKN